MRVTFIQGPLDGDVRDIPEDELPDGAVIIVPAGNPTDEADTPGDETLAEYLYGGDGTAQYVAGVGPV